MAKFISDQNPKFTEGSTIKHILVMSGASSIGLIALFLVDLLDMLFISMLGEVELAAAVGFAGTLVFFSTSISIATSIAMGTLVSKAIGEKNRGYAKQLSISIMITAFTINVFVSGAIFFYMSDLLSVIGALGYAAERAKAYLYILLPSTPVIALAMASGAGLRAVGDAKRSMLATLLGGVVNAILDPLFIFGFSWNVEGAAFASVIARLTVFGFSMYSLIFIHKLVARPSFFDWLNNIKVILTIVIPAAITNIATPIGNVIATSFIARFGADFVAGYTVIGRLTPVCFVAIFALSGAVGPILGQNFGAKKFDRVKEILNNSLIVVVSYTIFVCIILYFIQGFIIQSFSLEGDASKIVSAFCTYVAISFIFNGTLFLANTFFNNFGKPFYSTALNLGKATFGTLPFVYVGSQWFGALGVLYGQALGAMLFGVIAITVLRAHCKCYVKLKASNKKNTLWII
ncbi:MATE efflux protein [Candidatus Photodesmus blepharus]|uniref:Multidrug resistance protein NorM n=1 Tax=Candidatus Photodesmus blepharonis TaxID=1179155 RepID=A0A084CMZ1_9GAMM|nr:MATE efflux protein [Candidatus Photodesmus blepharus]